ncbi:MAG: thiamine diphosphokinase [Treponema sp.]|nr:thiamine diphosphokinase [Treponema sp.]
MEKQLGIVFAGGEGPNPKTLNRLCGDLASRALTVAADSGLLAAEAAGIKPDWVIGDMDSLADETRLLPYPTERVIRHPVDKDYTDTELALDLLWRKGCDNTWIIGGGGGRIAHIFAIRDIFERERFPCRWITASEDIHCVDYGNNAVGNHTDGRGLEPGDTVSVFPLGAGPWKAESLGLKWPLDSVIWERGLYGFGNIVLERELSIRAVQGRFMIILERVCQQL